MVSASVPRHFPGVLGFFAAFVFLWPGTFVRIPEKDAPPKQTKGTSRAEPELSIRQNGEFTAEHGIFVEEGQRLHVYSVVPEFWDERTGAWKATPRHDALKAQWKGEPYYHELYALTAGKWVKSVREFSEGPESWVDFGPCDPLNQTDLANDEIRKALPHSIRIKSIAAFPDYATVVYAETPKETYPRHSLDEYSLQVALLVRGGQGWRNAGILDAGADGFFCGTRTLSTKLADGETPTLLLLYSDEPAASSNFRTVRSYIVSHADAANRGPDREQAERAAAGGESQGPPGVTQIAACGTPNQPGPEETSRDHAAVEPGLPEKLAGAVADAESGVQASAIHVIPKRERGKVLLDVYGKPVADTVNYGLMQINSININKTTVKDAQGNPFTVGPDIITDWKANARAGIALLARQYRLAEIEQGAGGTEESCAQQAYSGYHGGTRNRHSYQNVGKE
ncbi:MAG: transglycosylase SLT domain-containing protein [Acidobacteriia bacterium]|nr:transglycosylase SLT domain-containing protein [Terriglobia bacterium]